MINKFIEIIPNYLYRGSCPTPQDVFHLKKQYKINKIISLDYLCGKKIDRTCKLLKIEHIIIPINIENIKLDVFNLLKYNLKDLLLNNGPTFIHCFAGKDRTGLLSALFKIKYMETDPQDALEEAKSIGMGIGLDPNILKFFERIILNCKKQENININQTIVSNQRSYKSDNRDSFLDESRQGSFAPFLSYTRQFPYDIVYNPINDQSPTRENYNVSKNVIQIKEKSEIPMVGVFNNDAGTRGLGPVDNGGGFIY